MYMTYIHKQAIHLAICKTNAPEQDQDAFLTIFPMHALEQLRVIFLLK